MADKQNFASWLKVQREKRGWSQSDLAREANVTRAAINGIETESRGPGVDLCTSLAKAFRLPPEEVFRAAGLLPPTPVIEGQLKELVHLGKEMQEKNLSNALEDVIAFGKHRIELAEKRGENAAKPKKSNQ